MLLYPAWYCLLRTGGKRGRGFHLTEKHNKNEKSYLLTVLNLSKKINSEYVYFGTIRYFSCWNLWMKYFPMKNKIRDCTIFSAFFSLAKQLLLTEMVTRETFFKLDQVAIKHHYDNIWDSNPGFYSHVFFINFVWCIWDLKWCHYTS